jgi:glutamate decarboxylase
MVLAQYYNFVRYGRAGYRAIMQAMQHNADLLTKDILACGKFEVFGREHGEQLPLVSFRLEGEHPYDEFDIASQLAAERGWMVPAYTLPPNADHVTVLRILVKETLGQSLATTLAADIGTVRVTVTPTAAAATTTAAMTNSRIPERVLTDIAELL